MSARENPPPRPPGLAVMEMVGSPWIAQAIYVVAKLEIPDLIAGGTTSVHELAAATEVNADALGRVLRALTVPGLMAEKGGDHFALTEMGETLRKDVPGSMHAMAVMFGEEFHWRPTGNLLHSVRTGQSAYPHVFGEPIFTHFQKHPAWSEIFNTAMTGFSRSSAPAIAAGFPWGRFKKLVDVGGGHGMLLGAILEANPDLKGTVYDLPQVVEGARHSIPKSLEGRLDAAGGDFFEKVPAGADAYMMKHIIHDWSDDHCVRLLQNVRKVIPADGTLVVIEMVVPPAGQPSFAKLMDLEMLLMTEGGRERTEAQFAALFARGGFKLVQVHMTPSGHGIIEGKPV